MNYSHEWAMQQHFFCPAPWGSWEGSKGQISFNFNYKVNFKDFCTNLCVCSHKWKIQNIRWDFNSVTWVMPWGSDFVALGVPRGVQVFFLTWSYGISNQWGWLAEQNASKIFIRGSNWWPWGEVKRSNIYKFQLPCQFQRFFYTKLC